MRIKISEDVSREYYETVKDILENKDFIKLDCTHSITPQTGCCIA